MTAVDADALDAARAAVAEWMRTHLFWGLDPSKAPEAADQLFALPEFAALIAEVRRGRALREAVEPVLRQIETAEDESTTAERRLVRRLRVALAAVDGS